MSSFTSELKLEPLPDGRKWKLVEEFVYYLGTEDSGMFIKVPEGFVTDFASVPRIFWIFLPPWGRYGKAAVLHDYMYQNTLFIRLLCDSIFYEAMVVLKVPRWQRWLLYLGVRIGGWFPYRRYVKKRIEKNVNDYLATVGVLKEKLLESGLVDKDLVIKIFEEGEYNPSVVRKLLKKIGYKGRA